MEEERLSEEVKKYLNELGRREGEFRYVGEVELDSGEIFVEIEWFGNRFLIPLSRCIPHPMCETILRLSGVKDANQRILICARHESWLGIALFRHIYHLLARGKTTPEQQMDVEERRKALPIPPDTDLRCVADLVVKGRDVDEAYRVCLEKKPHKKKK